MAKYILSDPNFSDGTHSEVIEKIIDQFRGRPGVKLIGYEPDLDFDRLPAELLGRPRNEGGVARRCWRGLRTYRYGEAARSPPAYRGC